MLQGLKFTPVAVAMLSALTLAPLAHGQNAASVWNSDSPNWSQAQEAKKQKRRRHAETSPGLGT